MTVPAPHSNAPGLADPAVLAHELRTPLNAIIGFAETLSLAALGPLPEAYRDYGAIIHRAALHLLALTESLGGQPAAPSALDPWIVASEIVTLLHRRAEAADVTFGLLGPSSEVLVRMEDRALRQILINLIDNALKFTAPGGAVAIAVTGDASETQITIDNSGGREAPGSGLGLPLVRDLCAAQGGDLTLRPRDGGGMTAMVRLPHAPEA